MAQAQAANKAMYEEKNKMMIEIRKLKDELHESEAIKTDLQDKLLLVQDSVKAIGSLKEQLFQRDEIIQQLRTDFGNLQGEAYEANRKTSAVTVELNSRIEQLNDIRESSKLLQVEKVSLTNENKEKDIQIKNLLEELKLTKEAMGDSGGHIGQLTKDLRNAKEKASKAENEVTDLKQTLEIRTKNFLKEKADLKT